MCVQKLCIIIVVGTFRDNWMCGVLKFDFTDFS